jgi:Ca-activated chloride channel family protein
MNPKNKIDVEDLLSSYPAPPPPEDLAHRIHLEIPRLASVPTPTKRARDPRRWMQAAALVVLTAGAAYAAYRVMSVEQRPDLLRVGSRTASIPGSSPARRSGASVGVVATPPTNPKPQASKPPRSAAKVAPKQEPLRIASSSELVYGSTSSEKLARIDAANVARQLQNDPSGVRPAPSTGGTNEPNDQPYGDVFFKAYGTNPFVDTDEDRFSTFGLDVDTGSFTVARRVLADGNLPPADAIRVEEFLNAFDYGDPAPTEGDFAVAAAGGPSPYPRASDRYRILRFGLRARDVDPRDRKPATLVFVVDVSGSMQREDRLGLVKQALGLLLDRLRPFDRVGLVVFGTDARAILEPTGDHETIRRAIERLAAEGSTNAEAGLQVGYDMAERHLRGGWINRVILCSDGVANVGRTGPDSILSVIERQAKAGIELTTVGFGMGNYNDVLMEQLADRGNGHYAYVDTLQEARRVFVENLTGTLQTVAADAKVQVEFDPLVVSRYRLLGYENRDIADEKFRDDRVDAGEIGAGHRVSAVYEIKLAEGATAGEIATLRLRYRPADAKDFVEIEKTLRLEDFAKTWDRSPRSLRLAALVTQLAEVLKDSYWARGVDASLLARQLRELAGEMPGDARIAELAEIAERAESLRARKASAVAPGD